METFTHTFKLNLSFEIMGFISGIDRFGGEWSGIERREGRQTLKQLKSIATVHSVGASTRIEGSKMTDDEVRAFIFNNVKIEKLVERDHQEVLGYFNVLDIISESYQDIDITESSIQNLHNLLMKYSDKDQYHKGKYKSTPNSVEATHPDGSKTIVFSTAAPGIETEGAMRVLIEWYKKDISTPPLIKSALFVYDFLSIHPFQDGNGRLSRLLATLLLLKNGYPWIQYVSFEHEIENRKATYYRVLMECQQQRPGEDVTNWLLYFLECLSNIQTNLKRKLDGQKSEHQISPRVKMIYNFIDAHPGSKSGEIAKKLNIPLPTIKKILAEMLNSRLISKYGNGPGTNYTTEKLTLIKSDVALKLTSDKVSKEFIVANRHCFVAIKKIILTPKFEWNKPSDWYDVLMNQQLELKITCQNNKGDMRSQQYFVGGFVSPMHYQPIFTFNDPMQIPLSLWEKEPNENEFPIKANIMLICSEQNLKFDLILVYDASLE